MQNKIVLGEGVGVVGQREKNSSFVWVCGEVGGVTSKKILLVGGFNILHTNKGDPY